MNPALQTTFSLAIGNELLRIDIDHVEHERKATEQRIEREPRHPRAVGKHDIWPRPSHDVRQALQKPRRIQQRFAVPFEYVMSLMIIASEANRPGSTPPGR